MYILDKRTLVRCIFLGVAFILALPFDFGQLTGISNWFSPFLMLSSAFLLKSFVILNLIGFIILLATWFKTRWFCRYLCPVGFSLDIVTRCFWRNKNITISGVPNINKWLATISLGGALFGFSVFLFFDPMVIFNGFFVSFIHPFDFTTLLTIAALPLLLVLQTIVPGLWCEKLCPAGGLQLSISELKNFVHNSSSAPTKNEAGRRLFLGGVLGVMAAMALPNFVKRNIEPAIRPPGSIEVNHFNTLCIRCGSCIKVCPTKILEQETQLGLGLLTPKIKFKEGYCLENCNLCSVVCPSGAISHYSIEEKHRHKVGNTVVNFSRCLLMKQKECAICKQACHYDAIKFVEADNQSIKMKPAINDLNCNGCGACVIICPENCIEIQVI